MITCRARTSRSSRWTSLPSAIRSDTTGSANPAPGSALSARNRPPRTPDDTVTHLAPPRRHAVTCRNPALPQQPRHATAVAVPFAAPETQGQRAASRLTSAIAANGQLAENWPSSGQIHRRVAMCARSLQDRRTFLTASYSALFYIYLPTSVPIGSGECAGSARNKPSRELPDYYTRTARKTIVIGAPGK